MSCTSEIQAPPCACFQVCFLARHLTPSLRATPLFQKDRCVGERDAVAQIVERFAINGDISGGGTPEDFARLIKSEYAKWKDVVEKAGVKLE